MGKERQGTGVATTLTKICWPEKNETSHLLPKSERSENYFHFYLSPRSATHKTILYRTHTVQWFWGRTLRTLKLQSTWWLAKTCAVRLWGTSGVWHFGTISSVKQPPLQELNIIGWITSVFLSPSHTNRRLWTVSCVEKKKIKGVWSLIPSCSL